MLWAVLYRTTLGLVDQKSGRQPIKSFDSGIAGSEMASLGQVSTAESFGEDSERSPDWAGFSPDEVRGRQAEWQVISCGARFSGSTFGGTMTTCGSS
jgi:hypothetical protein